RRSRVPGAPPPRGARRRPRARARLDGAGDRGHLALDDGRLRRAGRGAVRRAAHARRVRIGRGRAVFAGGDGGAAGAAGAPVAAARTRHLKLDRARRKNRGGRKEIVMSRLARLFRVGVPLLALVLVGCFGGDGNGGFGSQPPPPGGGLNGSGKLLIAWTI